MPLVPPASKAFSQPDQALDPQIARIECRKRALQNAAASRPCIVAAASQTPAKTDRPKGTSAMLLRLAATLVLAAFLAVPAAATPVLMISIDGLRPSDVTDARARGLKVPVLRGFMANGASAMYTRTSWPRAMRRM